MGRGSLIITVYPNFTERVKDTILETFQQSDKFRILVSDGIILDYGFMERLRRMNVFMQRILTSHQLVRIMADDNPMDSCLVIRSRILDDWGMENTNYFLDTLPLWPSQKGARIFLFLIGRPSPVVRMNHTMGIAFYPEGEAGERVKWEETAPRQGRLLNRWEK
ncbi:hypothetical protein ACNF40_05280 [Cuniculiplasma sp. SKW4]|uniref:hypothetical protein n=1 Tax=Cuniculiplasma sp. SKW4 TaxID=3400171 RepID=UPI003FD5BC11